MFAVSSNTSFSRRIEISYALLYCHCPIFSFIWPPIGTSIMKMCMVHIVLYSFIMASDGVYSEFYLNAVSMVHNYVVSSNILWKSYEISMELYWILLLYLWYGRLWITLYNSRRLLAMFSLISFSHVFHEKTLIRMTISLISK